MEPSRICSNFFLTYTQFIFSAIFISVFWAASGWWRFILVTYTGKDATHQFRVLTYNRYLCK